MRHPITTTLIISTSVSAIALLVQAANNRSLAKQLAENRGLEQPTAIEQAETDTAPSRKPGDGPPEDSAEERFDRAVVGVEQFLATEEKKLPQLLEAVKGLSASLMIEIARQTPDSDTRNLLLLIAARQEPIAILENEELIGCLDGNSVLAALGRSDPLAALDRLPPVKPMDPENRGSQAYQDEDIKLRTHLAILAMGVNVEAGLRAFLEARTNDPSKTDEMRPVGALWDMGRPPLSEKSIPDLVAAIDDLEFEPIRDDLIKMTLDHYLHAGGLASAAAQAAAMPLSPTDLKSYIESLKMYNIMKLEPVPTMNWVSTVLPASEQRGIVPALFLDWVKQEAVAAGGWLGEQSPSPVRDDTIASFATTAPSLDRESAALWALEIQDTDTRTNILRSVVEQWRREDASAAAQWVEQNGVEL